MTATNEAWISDSLARLEQLEAQRDQLARSGRTEALAELDEEIKSLYEVLESAAESEGTEAANTSPEPSVPHPAFGPTPYPVASAMGYPPAQAPVQSYAPEPVAQQPVYAPEQQYAPQPQYAPEPEYSPQAEYPPQPMMPVDAPQMMGSSYDSDDEPSSGKGAIIGIAVVLLLAAGGGGWWFMNRTTEAPAVEAPAGPAKVIQAGAIPEDTQEPDVAKGGEASRTPGIVIKQPPADDRRPSGPRPSGSSTPRPSKPAKPGRSDIDVAKGNDPLAGVK